MQNERILSHMKPASVNDIKQELLQLKPHDVLELCLKLARYKKENKELLSYLLFEANDQQAYLENVKAEIDEHFSELPKGNLYHTKKGLRKLLKLIVKYSRHTGSKQAEAEMLIHFCQRLKHAGIPLYKTTALGNLYSSQLKKVAVLLESVHEDLLFDYKKQLEDLLHS